MRPLAQEDVVLSDEWLHVLFDLGGDPEAGAEKQGLDPLQGPVKGNDEVQATEMRAHPAPSSRHGRASEAR